jgi:hypothetical protein
MMLLLLARGLLVARNNLPHHSQVLLTIILMNRPQIPMMMLNFVLTLHTVTLNQTLLHILLSQLLAAVPCTPLALLLRQ